MDYQDDDDDDFEGMYGNGYWEWDDGAGALAFKSNIPEIIDIYMPTAPNVIRSIKFKEDLDLIEQQRFRKKLQRKPVENDVVHLQDIKDVVCYTAPKGVITPLLIRVLHLPVTERFMRALLLYCQYFLQVSNEMSNRILEECTKIPTPRSEEIEIEFRENLQDLRVLVAKEYYNIIIGAGEIAKFHHMGAAKDQRSLSKRDSQLFEMIVKISVQIVWLALGRKSYNQIEIEVHRLFKSELYNIIEHNLKTKYESKLSKRELFVLFGHCVRHNKMLSAISPLHNEINCDRGYDYRLLGLGTIKYAKLSYRLLYLSRALVAPEAEFAELNVTLGILGLPRSSFDIMLRELKASASTATSSSSVRQSMAKLAASSRTSRVSTQSRKSAIEQKLYQDIYLPENEICDKMLCHLDFPTEMLPKRRCNVEQKTKWLKHIAQSKRKLKEKDSPSNRKGVMEYFQKDVAIFGAKIKMTEKCFVEQKAPEKNI